MKWSRRPANWRNIPLVADVFERWKHPGYSLLNVLFEIYTERFDPAPGWVLRISLQSLRREARFHRMPDMVKILRWIGGWPDNQQPTWAPVKKASLSELCPELYPELCPEPRAGGRARGGANLARSMPEPDLNLARSMPELDLNLARSMPEPDLNLDRIVLELTKTHALIMIPNFLELCDYYTKQRAAELAQASKVASKCPESILSKSIINKDRDGPASEALLALVRQIAELSARNGKALDAGKFTAKAVVGGCHPAAIIETLSLVVKNWGRLDTPWPWAMSTLEEKSKKAGFFDWNAHPEDRAVWVAMAGKQQQSGGRT